MKKDSKHPEKSITTKKGRALILSFFLLGSGIVLILGNIGIIDKEIFRYIFSWQSLLIALGIFILTGGARSHWFGSFILISLGALFMVDEYYSSKTGTNNMIWPLILIIVGIGIIIKILIPKKCKRQSRKYAENSHFGIHEDYNEEDFINISRVFTGIELIVKSENFQGGKASFVFGGGEIDLREAKLAEGTFILKVECVFGGVKIFVPKNWDVSIESSGVFGGFSDERRYLLIDEVDKSRKLIIKAESVFGGGEISN